MSTPPKASPGAGQDALLDAGATEQLRRFGPVEAAVRRSIEAAQLEATDEGLGAGMIAAAKAVDVAVARSDPYGVAQALRELRETAARLRLDPVSRDGAPTGDVERFLRDLSNPT